MKSLTVFRSTIAGLCLSLPLLLVTGCASSPVTTPPGGGGGSTGPVPDEANLSGNWQGSLTPAPATPALSAIAGAINQAGSKTSLGQFTTAILQIAGDCFVATPVIPLQGFNKAGVVTLDSYTVNGQMVHLSGQADAAASSVSGTYSVTGGCANGASGSLNANRYSTLTGTYTGTLSSGASAGPTVTLNLTQDASETGSGTFLLTGDITIAGTGCTMKGTASVSASNFVRGSSVQVSFPATDATGGTARLTGTFDVAASTIGNISLGVTGGTCAGFAATGTLKH